MSAFGGKADVALTSADVADMLRRSAYTARPWQIEAICCPKIARDHQLKISTQCTRCLSGLIIGALTGSPLPYRIQFFQSADPVPKIMIRCPVLGRGVPTGLTTEQIVFDSLPSDLEIPMRCPACVKIHKWKPKDAWVEKVD